MRLVELLEPVSLVTLRGRIPRWFPQENPLLRDGSPILGRVQSPPIHVRRAGPSFRKRADSYAQVMPGARHLQLSYELGSQG
jgi:hypothetical protein